MILTDLAERGVPDGVIAQWRARHQRTFPANPETLTHLQRRVFQTEAFWDPQVNVLVQGQTSSGKTLVAEAAAAQSVAAHDKSALYLVPFRAMVAEKHRDLEAAMGRAVTGWNVFASSSDFQENDNLISRGRYNVTVVVYEKLFALLAQPKNRVLQNCGLVIVDECQLLSDVQRGPKLEFILSRIARDARSMPRVVCLTNLSSVVDSMQRWLSAEVIADPTRPKQLREGVCSVQGRVKVRLESPDGTVSPPKWDNLGLTSYDQNDRDTLTLALTRHHVESGHRVLIFRSTKNNTVVTANNLARGLPALPLNARVQESLDALEEDEAVVDLKRRLVARGVAYHNASLSWEVRDFVEDEFKLDDGYLKVVVATETLAMGVNLPADVVIVSDLKKPSAGEFVDILPQEYKNYVGRAGRFGKGTLEHGLSYLLAENPGQIDTLWNKYVEAKPLPIKSAFRGLPDASQATYVLNWIAATRQSYLTTLSSYLHKTLAYSEDSQDTAERVGRLIERLESAGLVQLDGDVVSATSIGEAVAGFALSLHTIARLGRLRKTLVGAEPDKLPTLDVLFGLCRTDEIEALAYPTVTSQDSQADKPLRTLLRGANLPMSDGSELDQLRRAPIAPNTHDLLAAKRALLLLQWIDGTPIAAIRKETQLAGFSTGDITRLADVTAFLMEALASLCNVYDDTQKITKGLRVLAGRVQYGVPAGAVPLANRHVRGVTRQLLRRLVQAAPDRDLVAYVLLERDRLEVFPPGPRRRLIEALTRRLNQSGQSGVDEHKSVVNSWIRLNTLPSEWKSLLLDYYGASSDPDRCAVVAQMLESEPLRLQVERTSATSLTAKGAGRRVSLVMHQGEPDRLLSWAEVNSSLSTVTGAVPKVVVGSPAFDEECGWRAKEAGGLLLTSEAFMQACLSSVAEARTGEPLIGMLAETTGGVDLADVGSLIRATVSKQSAGAAVREQSRCDVFLAHARADKDDYVRPLASKLAEAGVSVWLDEAEIVWGDDLIERINDGLRNSRFVVLCISKAFMEKPWPNAEMSAALARQNATGAKVVLPLVLPDASDVASRYPLLAGIVHLSWDVGLAQITEQMARVLRK